MKKGWDNKNMWDGEKKLGRERKYVGRENKYVGWEKKRLGGNENMWDGTFWDEKRLRRDILGRKELWDGTFWDKNGTGTGHQFLASPVAKVNYSVTNKFLGIIVKPWSSRISHVGCDTVRNLNF